MHGYHHRRFRGMTAEAMRAAADAMEASGEEPTDEPGDEERNVKVLLSLVQSS